MVTIVVVILGATADWVLRQPPCDLTSTATGFYKRKYALAVANQSPLRDKINEALIELQFSDKFEVGVSVADPGLLREMALTLQEEALIYHLVNFFLKTT